ncbi:MAG: ABC transporter permease subunit [Planctomycetes bacterium]|nr:ABC transporter permease subunit [Planctomycetota bacterium]
MTNRVAVIISLLVLVVISLLPLARTVAESFIVRDNAGRLVEVTTERYRDLFVGQAAPSATPNGSGVATPNANADETPANRPAWKRWTFLGNSAAIALVAALLALAVGVPYALLVARTDVPLRGFLGVAYGAPLVLPPLLVGVAWSYIPFLAPARQDAIPEPSLWDGPIAIFRAGAAFALCYFPLVVLFATRAVRRVPAALEDAARLVAGPWTSIRRVTLPLAAPTILASGLFVFLFALEDFALVDFLNWVRPVGQRVGVYPYESFTAWTKSQGEGIATALGMPLVLTGIALLVVIHRLTVKDARTGGGGSFREAEPWKLGRWRWPAALSALLLLGVAAGLPVGGLIWKAGQGGLTAYRNVWHLVAGADSQGHELAWSLWFSVAAAVIAVPVAWPLAHHAARRKVIWPLVVAFLPLALPPIFLGAGSLRLYDLQALAFTLPDGSTRNPFVDPDSPRLGTVLLLVAKYVPFAVAALWAAFLGVDPDLEGAAATAGVRPLDRALGVLAPLVRPALVLSLVLVFVFSLREIDTTVLLSSETLMRKIYTMVHFQRDEQVAALCVVLVALEALPFAFLSLLMPRPATAPDGPTA